MDVTAGAAQSLSVSRDGDLSATSAPHTVTIAGDLRDVRVARIHARKFMAANHLGAAADDVALVVSELVTNALLHGRGPITMTLTLAPPELIIAVRDEGESSPTDQVYDDDAESGRGLGIVRRLAARLLFEPSDGAKSVVAAVRLPER